MESELVLVKVHNSSLVSKSLEDLPLPAGTVITLLVRQGEEPKIPTPETVLQAEDQLVCLIPSESEESVQAIFASNQW